MPEDLERDLVSSLLCELNPTPSAHLSPITTPLLECFDFNKLFERDQNFSVTKPMKFYLVAFRSVRSAAADDKLLYKLDEQAHLEAQNSGGLLKYWYGVLNTQRECLAMCIWSSREAAIRAAALPAHIQAASVSSTMYDKYTLEKFWLELSPPATSKPGFSFSLTRISQIKH